MDNPNAVGSDAFGNGREFKITAAMLKSLPASPALIILGDLPLGWITQIVRFWVDTPVAGSACALQLMTVNSNTLAMIHNLGASFDGTQAAGTQVLTQLSTANDEPTNVPTSLAVQVTAAGFANITAGVISIFARGLAIAPAPPLRYDTTAQTPRVMPPY